MDKKIVLGILIGLVIIIGGLILYKNQDNNKKGVSKSEQVSEKMTGEDKMNSNAMEETAKMKDDKMMEKNTMQKSGSYKDYSPATVEAEQKAGNKVVLFFHAKWCPDCKAADAAFQNNPENIPAGVTVLKTDYDSNNDLKTKYAVTYQHTFVQIDDNEKLITKWNSGDIDMLIKNIK